MRRFVTIIAAFLLVVILVVVEIIIIKGASDYEPEVEVIFARTKIPEKSEITEEMLEVRKIGVGMVHRLSVRNTVDATGKVAAMDIEEGEMILSSKLGSKGMKPIEVKDKSKRLFTVEFRADQANGWWLMTDEYVDIIFVPSKSARSAETDSTGDAVENGEGLVRKLRNIRIAALIDENGKLLDNKSRSTLPKYISFEVTEQQADFLAYAKGNGRLEICAIPR